MERFQGHLSVSQIQGGEVEHFLNIHPFVARDKNLLQRLTPAAVSSTRLDGNISDHVAIAESAYQCHIMNYNVSHE